ncbi:unnamed protein product [Dibothriocephalus latus]|uniref:Uncharacterized protein n=1 Tax=Dibothriocephalus latus TaxID=60516 RepID=A0A3P7LRX5_DIBLA|nr:unnamed protein product [Dibothriocephalus latus]
MFAALVTGKPVITDFAIVAEGKFLFNLPCLESSNHLVVFLTGQTPLPEGYGAAVHFGFIDNGVTSWYYLGFLLNERPSAIYKVSGLKPKAESIVSSPFGDLSLMTPSASVMAQLGISIEPLSELVTQTPAVNNVASQDAKEGAMRFTQFAAENLYNFASGCAVDIPGSSQPLVPLSTIQQWYEATQRKLLLNPDFWKKIQFVVGCRRSN